MIKLLSFIFSISFKIFFFGYNSITKRKITTKFSQQINSTYCSSRTKGNNQIKEQIQILSKGIESLPQTLIF